MCRARYATVAVLFLLFSSVCWSSVLSLTVSQDVITGRTWHGSNDWVAETYPDSSVVRSGGGLTDTGSDPAVFQFAGIQLAPDEKIANAVLQISIHTFATIGRGVWVKSGTA